MDMCVLGSGSGGNCTVVRAGGGAFMIDAGLGPRTVARRLHGSGFNIHEVRALYLTHLDGDHFTPTWFPILLKHSIALHVHARHIYHLYQSDEQGAKLMQKAGLICEFQAEPLGLRLGGEQAGEVLPLLGAHDRTGVVSYRVQTASGTLTFATDVGHVTDALVRHMTDVDLLAIESNYDEQMQVNSPRPAELKRRIMGGRGHLSNDEAYGAVCKAMEGSKSPPAHVVLLHLSRQCNTPEIARGVFERHPLIAGRLCVTNQLEPTRWLSVEGESRQLAGRQLSMFA